MDQVYPTTPSTFPQPVNPSPNHQTPLQPQDAQNYHNQQTLSPQQHQQQQQQQQQLQQQHQQPYGYFPPTPSYFGQDQNQHGQQQQQQQQQQQHYDQNGDHHHFQQLKHLQVQQQQQHQAQNIQRALTPGSDPNGGLAQRFAELNNHGAGGGNGLPPSSSTGSMARPQGYSIFQMAPQRDPELYGPNANNNQRKCVQLAADFFKDSVRRARERNQRQNDLEIKLQDPNQTPARREQLWCTHGRKEGQYLRFLRTKDKPENYTTIKIIGKGAFGEVKLVQKKSDQKIYAMKSLIKTEMFRRDQLAHVRAERDILAESDSPWVVKLYTTFQDTNFLYMLMEFLPGGDLMTMLIKYEIFTEDITRFYMAEIVLAIEAVHNLSFIHRDIKPDNILLDRGGHVKLTDFGLSTGFQRLHDNTYYRQLLQGQATRRRGDRNSIAIDQINLTVSNRSQINDWRRSRRLMAYSTVGTPDYIAPEIFTGSGYSFDCDWWSLGTIMFECLVGWPPFCAEDSHETYRKIINWPQTLFFPDDIQLGLDAENLIRRLVCNTENRLGRGGAHEIKAHPFFRGVEFDQLRRIRAPFEPRLKSAIDTTYFPVEDIDQTDNATLLKVQAMQNGGRQPEEAPEMSLPFIGYTFKRFDNNFR